MINIQISYEETPSLKIKNKFIQENIESIILAEKKMPGDISLIFCSDEYLLNINKQYLNHNYYTDIITFDYCENLVISGDLFISVDRVRENAGTYNVAFKNELFRVIFHGILHLLGYNDKTQEEKAEIRQKEEFYLAKIDLRGLEL